MPRTPRKSPIKTRPIPPLGSQIELIVWKSPIGNYSIDLEDWQVEAMQQILGLRAEFSEDENGYFANIIGFAREEVEKRIQKMGRLAMVVEENENEGNERANPTSTASEPI